MSDTIACPHCSKAVVVPKSDFPPGLVEICQQFPALCREFGALRTQTEQVLDAVNRHPKPTEDFIQKMWRDCPDCQKAFDQLLVEHPKLFVPKEEDDAEPFYVKSDYGL